MWFLLMVVIFKNLQKTFKDVLFTLLNGKIIIYERPLGSDPVKFNMDMEVVMKYLCVMESLTHRIGLWSG